MKVNLLCGENLLPDYINLDHRIPLINNVNNYKFIAGYYNDLNPFFKDESIQELIFNDYANIIGPETIVGVFGHWNKKLKLGAKLSLKMSDVTYLSRFFSYMGHDSRTYNTVFKGNNGDFKSVLDVPSVKNILRDTGYKITKLYNQEDTFYIEAEKCSQIS